MNTHFPLALVLTLAPLLSQEKDFTISQQLPTGTRKGTRNREGLDG